mmetsp:Transcript_12930/g.40338  ORF Transcript_12930/g.40338 Transcript_12930/m.40338 type:complete len:207 (+) Transcript_12930:713-1333(+)
MSSVPRCPRSLSSSRGRCSSSPSGSPARNHRGPPSSPSAGSSTTRSCRPLRSSGEPTSGSWRSTLGPRSSRRAARWQSCRPSWRPALRPWRSAGARPLPGGPRRRRCSGWPWARCRPPGCAASSSADGPGSTTWGERWRRATRVPWPPSARRTLRSWPPSPRARCASCRRRRMRGCCRSAAVSSTTEGSGLRTRPSVLACPRSSRP